MQAAAASVLVLALCAAVASAQGTAACSKISCPTAPTCKGGKALYVPGASSAQWRSGAVAAATAKRARDRERGKEKKREAQERETHM